MPDWSVRNMFMGLGVLATVLCLACSKDPEVAKRAYLAQGDQLVAQKKLDEAVIAYRNAVQQDARFGEARFKLAELYLQTGNMAGAYSEYVRAADLLPADVQAQLKAGQMHLAARQFDEAKGRAEKVLAIDPNNVDGLVLKGNALAGLKNLDAAITDVEAAIDIDQGQSRLYSNLGALQLAKGNTAEAEKQFVRAVEVDPKGISPRLALANYYWSTGQTAKAEENLKSALAIDPKDVSTNRALAIFYVASKRTPEAEPYLKMVADTTQASLPRMALADYYTQNNRTDEAIAVLETIVQSDAKAAAIAKGRIASILYNRGRTAEAHATIDGALKEEPKNPFALMAKADLLTRDGKLDEAVQHLHTAVAVDPKAIPPLFALGRIQAARRDYDGATKSFQEVLRLNPRAVPAQVELAKVHLAAARPDEALVYANQALAESPNLPDALFLRSRALLKKGDARQAEPATRRLAAALPNSAPAQAQLGTLQSMKGDSKSARTAFERALSLDSANYEALEGLVALDLAAKQPAAALTRVSDAIAARPKDSALTVLQARIHLTSGNLQAAESVLRKAIEIDASNLQTYALLASVYARQNRLADATLELENVVKRQPKNVPVQILVGMLLEAQKRTGEARVRYEQALAVDPKAPVAANNLAWIYATTGGNLDAALQLAKTAKAGRPDSPEINDTLGWIYYRKNLPALAIPSLIEAVEKSPGNAEMHYHLGMAYAKTGEKDKARQALNKAISLGTFEGADEARRTLEELKS